MGPVRNFESSKNKQLLFRVHSLRNATQVLRGSPKFLLAPIFFVEFDFVPRDERLSPQSVLFLPSRDALGNIELMRISSGFPTASSCVLLQASHFQRENRESNAARMFAANAGQEPWRT